MKIEVTAPTLEDYEEFGALNASACLEGRVKLICQDDEGHEAVSFMDKETFDRLGLDYITSHAKLEYSRFLDSWSMVCSQNDWYNDPERNPEKVIPVRFVEIDATTGREVYVGINFPRYYLRDVSHREPFAKWYICGQRQSSEGYTARPNLIFQHGDQREKVVYDDWDGAAAYSKQFNPDFNREVSQL